MGFAAFKSTYVWKSGLKWTRRRKQSRPKQFTDSMQLFSQRPFIQLPLTVLSPSFMCVCPSALCRGWLLQRQSQDQKESAAAQHRRSTMINEFVLSVSPASCLPRSLVIKLPLVNVLNTDWWMIMANEGLLWLLLPPSQFSQCKAKTFTRLLLTCIEFRLAVFPLKWSLWFH